MLGDSTNNQHQSSQSDVNKYAHQIREVNFDDQKEELATQNMENVVDYFFNHKVDLLQMTGSIVVPDSNAVNEEKRFSVYPVLSMFIRESPKKEDRCNRGSMYKRDKENY